ncbi:hypothetical protein FB451DRAFT_1371204 [Mycena latifolia]|nr:hypothetical protein FB451DRAFT_1371204 [Mycena latifolia]
MFASRPALARLTRRAMSTATRLPGSSQSPQVALVRTYAQVVHEARQVRFNSRPAASDLLMDYGDLTSNDFPEGWEAGQHPDDYKILSAPLKPELFIKDGGRMWYRISIKISDAQYMPMSFLVVSGAPDALYLSSNTMEVLVKHKRVQGLDSCRASMRLKNGLVIPVSEIPETHKPINLLGYWLIQKFGLDLNEERCRWAEELEYW